MASEMYSIILTGIAVEIFDYVMHKAGIEYIRVPIPKGIGYGALGENGTWNGYLGIMQQGVVDTVAAEFYATEMRTRAFAHTRAFAIEGMLCAAPDTHEEPRFIKLASLLFAMFDLPLWSLIAAAACACVTTMLVTRARWKKLEKHNAKVALQTALRRGDFVKGSATSMKWLCVVLGFSAMLLLNMYQVAFRDAGSFVATLELLGNVALLIDNQIRDVPVRHSGGRR